MSVPDAHKRQWLAMLAKMVSPEFPVQATDALIAMLPLLRDFPPDCFNAGSLETVACGDRRLAVPNLKELRAGLAQHRRDVTPLAQLAGFLPALMEAERADPTPEQVAQVAQTLTAWRQDASEKIATGPRPSAGPKFLSPRQLLATYEHSMQHASNPFLRACAETRVRMLRQQLGIGERVDGKRT